jgi:hypothetical protein
MTRSESNKTRATRETVTALRLQLADALNLLDAALDHGRVLHRTGCNCGPKRETCFSCLVRERIDFGRSALQCLDTLDGKVQP